MAMTIAEASAVTRLLHHLSGHSRLTLEDAAEVIDFLDQRAAKPLQLSHLFTNEAERIAMLTNLTQDRTLHVHEGRDGLWYWHAKAPNGEITAASENYTRRADAIRAATTEYPSGTRAWEQDQEDEQP